MPPSPQPPPGPESADPAWPDQVGSPSTQPSRVRILIGVVIGVVVVGLFAGAAVVVLTRTLKPARGAATPEAAVSGFLQAVAANHAETALSFEVAGVPHDRSFLTDDVLARAHRLDPISGIRTRLDGDPTTKTARVAASYLIGGQPTSTMFTLSRTSTRGDWTIDQTTVLLDLSRIQVRGVPLRLADRTVPGTTAELFPGTYRADTGLTRLDWGADPRVSVTDFDPDAPVQTKLALRLTASGRRDLVTAVKKASDACLARQLEKPGCGLDPLHAGYTFKNGTIRWRYDDQQSPWQVGDFDLGPSDPRIAVGPDEVLADLYATCTRTARPRNCQREGFGAAFGTPRADLTARTLEVSWG